MMQYTDMHDRFLLRLISKNIYLYTEMISTGSIIFGNCLDQFKYNHEEHPVAVQLGGSNPSHLAECRLSFRKGSKRKIWCMFDAGA